jgi:hypothetical protein
MQRLQRLREAGGMVGRAQSPNKPPPEGRQEQGEAHGWFLHRHVRGGNCHLISIQPAREQSSNTVRLELAVLSPSSVRRRWW